MNPVCVSTWHGHDKYFDAFIATANRNGIEPQNADPKFWPGTSWQDKEWFRKSEAQANYVKENADKYTHFLFCDSYDILFAAGWVEIMNKFLAMDSPIVFAAECYPWPKTDQASLYPPTERRCKYLNAGFWMGEAKAALEFISALEERAKKREQCDQGIAVDLFLSGKYPIKLDNDCSLCHCCNMDSLNFLKPVDGRPKNTETGQFPCLFHGNANSDLSVILRMMNL